MARRPAPPKHSWFLGKMSVIIVKLLQFTSRLLTRLMLSYWHGRPTSTGQRRPPPTPDSPRRPLPDHHVTSNNRTHLKLFKFLCNRLSNLNPHRRAVTHPTPPLLFPLFTGLYILVKLWCHESRLPLIVLLTRDWATIDEERQTNAAGGSDPITQLPSPRLEAEQSNPKLLFKSWSNRVYNLHWPP